MAKLSMELDKDSIEALLREQIQASVAVALAGSGEALVQQLVKETLDLKVDNDGKPSSWGKDTFAGYLVKQMIREAAKEAITDWIGENKGRIRRAVRRQMERHPDNIADAIVDSLHRNLSGGINWRFQVSICTNDDH